MGGGHEHLVRHQSRSARDRAQTDAGKDVGIVALPGHENSVAKLYRIVRAAACEQGATGSVTVGLFSRTFRLRGWVGECKDDRSLIDWRHRLEHLRREGAAHRRNA